MPWLSHQRRRISTLLLLAFTAAATGISLPVPQLARQSAERYPCENCGCGCNSADVCWTNCCCHTMAERLEWARKQGVRPPQQALLIAAAQGLDVRPWLESKPQITSSSCETPPPAGKKPCCCCCQTKAVPKQLATEEHSPLPAAPLWRAASCQGALKLWLSITVAPHELTLCEVPEPICESIVLPHNTLPILPTFEPSTPPPEITA